MKKLFIVILILSGTQAEGFLPVAPPPQRQSAVVENKTDHDIDIETTYKNCTAGSTHKRTMTRRTNGEIFSPNGLCLFTRIKVFATVNGVKYPATDAHEFQFKERHKHIFEISGSPSEGFILKQKA